MRKEIHDADRSQVVHDLTFGPRGDLLDTLADFQTKVTDLFKRKGRATENNSTEQVIDISGHPRV